MHRLKRLFRRTSTAPLTPTPTNNTAAGGAGASAPPLPRPPTATSLGGRTADIPPLSSSVRRSLRRRTASAAAARGSAGRPPPASGVTHPSAAPPPPPERAATPIPTETRPLTSIAELLSWLPDSAVDSALGCRVPLPAWAAARHGRRRSRRRLMLIHDFAGGYPPWEARPGGVGLPLGGQGNTAAGATGRVVPPKRNPPPPASAPVLAGDVDRDNDSGRGPPVHWRFAHWAYVDVFVTFSHARVSVPPAGATAAAHRHGALSLGTVLFEWAAGAADLRAVIGGPLSRRAEGVVALGRLAAARGFDGWLLNVEVDDLTPVEAAALRAWVADLTAAVHATVGAHGAVVWYDAVTAAGALRYQNGLTPANAPFFTAAGGGLLTNYAWDGRGPAAAAAAAGAAGRPPADVYMGVDVHGRGTYGGGGWGVATAVRATAAAGVSVGIFAPAWTVEGDGGPGGWATSTATLPAAQAAAAAREARFWTGPPGPAAFGSSAVAAYVRERPVLCGLPFGTDWDPGWGDGPPWVAGVRQSLPPPQHATDGMVHSDDGGSGGGGGEPQTGRWFCMARQAVQASFLRTVHAGGLATEASAGQIPAGGGRRGGVGPPLGGVRLCMDGDVAWSGGASVRVAFPPARGVEGEDSLGLLLPPGAAGAAAPEQGEASAERGDSCGREDVRDLTATPVSATPRAVVPPPPPLTPPIVASTATHASLAAAPESPFALLRLLVASAPFSASGTPLTVAYTLRGTPAASTRSGLALLFTRPVSLVLLVAADSAWTTAPQSALGRVRVHGRAAEVMVVPPSTAVAVGPAAATPDGASWTRRVYGLPAAAVAGRTLVEVLVLVGEPPPPPPKTALPPLIIGGGVTNSLTPPNRPTLTMSPPQWALTTPPETPPPLPRRMPSSTSSLGEHSSGGGSELSVAPSSRASARSASIRLSGGGVRLGSRRVTASARVLSLSGVGSRRGGGGGRGASSGVSRRRLQSMGGSDTGGASVADVATAAALAVAAVDRRRAEGEVAATTRRARPAGGTSDDGASAGAASAAVDGGGAGRDGDRSGHDTAATPGAAAQRQRLMSTPALLRGSRGWSIDAVYGEGVTGMGLADLRRAIEAAMARAGGGAAAGRLLAARESAAAAAAAAMSSTGRGETATGAATRRPSVVGAPPDLSQPTPAVPSGDPPPEVDPPEAAVIHIGTLSMAVTRRGGGGGGGRPPRGATGLGKDGGGGGGGGGDGGGGGGRRSQMPLPLPPLPPTATLPGKAPGGVGRVAERGRLGSGTSGGGGGGGGSSLPPPC